MKYSFWRKVQLKLIYLAAKKMGLEYVGGHFIKIEEWQPPITIVDLGANKGGFYTALNKKIAIKGCCVEANENLFQQLPLIKDLQAVFAAITDKNGEIQFNVSDNDEASSIHSSIAEVWNKNKTIVVPALTLHTLVEKSQINKIDIIKMDIEGAEIEVLNSSSDELIKKCKQITIEFHEFLDSSLAVPTYQIINRIQKLGFKTIVTSTQKYSEVLFLHPDVKFSFSEKIWYYIHQFVRYRAK